MLKMSDIRVAAIALVSVAIGASITGGLNYLSSSHQDDTKMVEVAIESFGLIRRGMSLRLAVGLSG